MSTWFMNVLKAEPVNLDELTDLEEDFGLTDQAISRLKPWRSEIPLKVFASRIRFQIRIDDLRESVTEGQGNIDDILGKQTNWPKIFT